MWVIWGWATPLYPTWVRMHTAAPSLQSEGCVCFHLDPFQTPVERKVIRVEDPLYTLVTDNASQNYNQCTNAAAACQKFNLGKASEHSALLQAPMIKLQTLCLTTVTSFKKGHCQVNSFLFPLPGIFYQEFSLLCQIDISF